MDLSGKKINFLGDSITFGCCATDNRGFVDILARDCHLAAARNYGIGGTRYARQRVPSEEASYDLDFCGRFAQMDPDADIILVFGGVNDFGHGDAPMGTEADRTPDTFLGACHFLYRGLRERFPAARLLVATPLHCRDETDPSRTPTLGEYVAAIRRTAAVRGIEVLDLYETSALDFRRPEIAGLYSTDGLHPNDLGHAVLAREIAAFLRSL